MKLYEFEDLTRASKFFRASKSTIINTTKISHVKPSMSGRFEVYLKNGECVLVSRQYVPELKNKLVCEEVQYGFQRTKREMLLGFFYIYTGSIFGTYVFCSLFYPDLTFSLVIFPGWRFFPWQGTLPCWSFIQRRF